jgi:hypothetical protein
MQFYKIIMEIPYNQINLNFNTDRCVETCPPILDYMAGYVNPKKNDSMVLASLSVKEYTTADEFFMRAFGKNTRYQYRQIEKEGYSFRPFSMTERNSRLDELYAINTSASERQGGAMNQTYFEYPKPLEQEKCPYHFHKVYVAFSPDNVWIGYIDLLHVGNWANTIHILGHHAYLDSCKRGSFMVSLWFCMVKDIIENHPSVSYIQYHMMDVGNPGLQEWKKRVGLQPTLIIP